MKTLSLCLTLSFLMLTAACAVSPEKQARQAAIDADIDRILSAPVEEGQEVEMLRCLSDNQYRGFRALDDRHILFEGRGDRLWINKLRTRCPDLRNATILRVRSAGMVGRTCDGDQFVASDWFYWPWYRRWPWRWGTSWGTGAVCVLGKFQPVTDEQLEAVETVLERR
jgi:hypothetical protein